MVLFLILSGFGTEFTSVSIMALGLHSGLSKYKICQSCFYTEYFVYKYTQNDQKDKNVFSIPF
jgi:hypothetical protein